MGTHSFVAMAYGPFQVIDPLSPWHNRTVFIEVESGHLRAIEPTAEPARAYLIPGGVDVLSWTRWPTDPCAESLIALGNRLYEAGYMEAIVASPLGWSDPDLLITLTTEARNAPISLYLLASFWDENQIAPVQSLRAAGAWGWTLPLMSCIPWRQLGEILAYLRYLGGPVFILPFWEALAEEVGVPRIPLLALSGWRGTPPIAETLALRLIAEIHRHAGGTLYVGPITTSQGLQTAQAENLTPFTALPYLFFSAERLFSYDSIWKIHPPLQDSTDQRALWNAAAAGRLSLMAAYHELVSPEAKDHPWAEAEPGMSTLPEGPALFFSVAERMGLSLERAVAIWAIEPRNKLGLTLPALNLHAPLKYVLLEPLAQPLLWRDLVLCHSLTPVGALASHSY